jgi:hypothetical protein
LTMRMTSGEVKRLSKSEPNPLGAQAKVKL